MLQLSMFQPHLLELCAFECEKLSITKIALYEILNEFNHLTYKGPLFFMERNNNSTNLRCFQISIQNFYCKVFNIRRFKAS